MLSEDLIRLYNTLALIETKGENTILMAQCMAFTKQMASEAVIAEQQKAKEPEPAHEKEEEQK